MLGPTCIFWANLTPFSLKCGIFHTGFAGTFYDVAHWRSVLEVTAGGGGNFSTAPLLWPVLYVRGSWG